MNYNFQILIIYKYLAHSLQSDCLQLCYQKFHFFNMDQPIDLTFCNMIEIIEQNFFNHEDFYLGPTFLFLAR